VDVRGLDQRIKPLLPHYMTMGHTGMGDMGEHLAMGHMKVPENSIPMLGGHGPFDYITMGGMFTVLKVRHGLKTYDDPGWYEHPKGTVAWQATADELRRDSVSGDGSAAPRPSTRPAAPAPPPSPAPGGHDHH
jgi:hypothetical protein